MFNCLNCGHPDMVHRNTTGECLHHKFKPKDPNDQKKCECKGMK